VRCSCVVLRFPVTINGVLRSTSSTINATGTLGSITDEFLIGQSGYTGSPYFNGKLGPMQIYNRALSANEVLHNYNALKGRFGL